MDTKEFVESLDKLNCLKRDGVINEKEFNEQVNQLKQQSLKENKNNYRRNNITNYSKNNDSLNSNNSMQNSAIASLFSFIIIVIGGIWFFTSDAFKDLSKIFEDADNHISYESTYTYTSSQNPLTTSTSNNKYTNTTSINTKISTQSTNESKSTYIASCKNYDSQYENIQRNPNYYKGLRMKFRGRVEQRWSKSGSTAAFTISACTSENVHVGMVYCTIDSSVLNGGNLLQDDYINVYGEFKGITNNLVSIYGYANYPSLEVKYIEFTKY